MYITFKKCKWKLWEHSLLGSFSELAKKSAELWKWHPAAVSTSASTFLWLLMEAFKRRRSRVTADDGQFHLQLHAGPPKTLSGLFERCNKCRSWGDLISHHLCVTSHTSVFNNTHIYMHSLGKGFYPHFLCRTGCITHDPRPERSAE